MQIVRRVLASMNCEMVDLLAHCAIAGRASSGGQCHRGLLSRPRDRTADRR
jgi:hypothetical protein